MFTRRPISRFLSSFRILGVQQIALGHLEKSALQHLWIDALGLEKIGHFTSERENVDEDILQIGKGIHAIEIDLMTPLDVHKSPKVHIPALNHIGLWVDDLDNAVHQLTKKGMRFTPGGIRKGASGHNVIFIHPKSSTEFPLSGEGVLIELVQAPASIVAAYTKAKDEQE